MRLFEICLILLIFYNSFWLGIIILTYIIIKNKQVNSIQNGNSQIVKNILNHSENEIEKAKIETDLLKDALREEEMAEQEAIESFSKPDEMPKHFVSYKGFVIEDYGGWYVIIKPDSQAHPKAIYDITEAQRVIDRLLLNEPIQQHERIKTTNVRIVK